MVADHIQAEVAMVNKEETGSVVTSGRFPAHPLRLPFRNFDNEEW
jgi:hypothetical protein